MAQLVRRLQPPRDWSALIRAAGHTVFRCRDVLAPVTILLVVASTRRADFLVPARFDRWLDGIGSGAVVLGLAIRWLVLAGSGIRRSGVRKRVAAPTLYEAGPYAWCRNPLYLANAIILIGLTLLFDSRWMVGIALPLALLAIRSIVASEERVLSERFGTRYRDYCRRVPRFLPQRFAALAAVRPLDWRRALRKEHGTIFGAVTTAVVLAVAEDRVRRGHTGWEWPEPAWLCAWLVVAALWAAVRYGKRTGRLRAVPRASPTLHVRDVPA